MSTDRFDDDLRSVLLERSAGGPPEALRARLAATPREAPAPPVMPFRRHLTALAAGVAAVAIVGGTLLAVLGLHGTILGPAVSPRATAPGSPAAVASAVPSAPSSGMQAFPSVAPDASSTSGLIEPGQVAVYADAAGPAVLIRVRDVQTRASVPGLTPRVEGDVYLEATVDFRVLHVPAGTFPGIGFIAER